MLMHEKNMCDPYIDNCSVHNSIFRLPQCVKGDHYKNKIKKLTPVLTTVGLIIINRLPFGEFSFGSRVQFVVLPNRN